MQNKEQPPGGPPPALIEATPGERADTTRRLQEMVIEISQEREHLEDIAPQAGQEPGVTHGE